MKLAAVLLLCALLPCTALRAQSAKVNINVKEATLETVFEQIRQQSKLKFIYNQQDIAGVAKVTLNRSNVSVEEVLTTCLRGTGITWEFSDNVIVLKKSRQQPARPAQVTIRGTVRDAEGRPIPGASVQVKGTQQGTVTDPNGQFTIRPVNAANVVLLFSVIGKQDQHIAYTGQETLNVRMEEVTSEIEDVVVTGMFERRKETFTGATVTFKQDDLRRVGNTNVLQSVKNLDPSFRFSENLAAGSNPNAKPEIQLRGQSGFPDLGGTYTSDPNAPYFIVDGFESSLTAVMDMDMNRIESVTLLKDAAAKAIYGSKAANGVVVIETIKPAGGKLRVTYNGSVNIQIPDLSSYNLTNAAEKLTVDVNAGHFDYLYDNGAEKHINDAQQYLYTQSYNALYDQVLRGVNTDWLAQPLRTGVGQKHSIYLEGGDKVFQYGLEGSYNNIAGVMKGSDKDTFTGGIKLSYRYKSLSFRNNLNITYNKGINSPYGLFGDYARMNPYFRTTDDQGNILAVPGDYIVGYIPPQRATSQSNPLYNAQLNSKNESQYTAINNNLYVEWTPGGGFKTTGRLSVTSTDTASDLFIPAKNTKFADYTSDADLKRKGSYTAGDGKSMNVTADINAQFSRTFAERHFVFANVGWNINSFTAKSHSFIAEGFPENDKLDDLAFAAQYALNGSPKSEESTTRSVGAVGSVNYSYADRYLLDASIRMSASSQFGTNNPWGTFWSFGLGWNIHHEAFMEGTRGWLNQLKLRGSVGYTGSQDFAAYQAKSTFSYYTTSFYNGAGGARLMAMANSDLTWQRKMDNNVGIDLAMFQSRFSARFDYYIANTDDLLTSVTLPLSTGFTSYVANLGEVRNTGFEANLRYRVWSDPARRSFLNVFVMGSHNQNKVTKISDALTKYNEKQVVDSNTTGSGYNAVNQTYIRRYVEGQSMNGIWAVPSLGIDPGSGKEMYVKQDGSRTYIWEKTGEDLRNCGNTEPVMNGSVGLNFDYRGFSFNVVGTWRFGGQIYNQTLIDKVENADLTGNVDRRIFESRWVKPGDVSRFKDIKNTEKTKATSRFVEDDDMFIISSINASYDFQYLRFMKRSGLERLRLILDMADIGRLSTVRVERGTDYPFAYSFSCTLQATF